MRNELQLVSIFQKIWLLFFYFFQLPLLGFGSSPPYKLGIFFSQPLPKYLAALQETVNEADVGTVIILGDLRRREEIDDCWFLIALSAVLRFQRIRYVAHFATKVLDLEKWVRELENNLFDKFADFKVAKYDLEEAQNNLTAWDTKVHSLTNRITFLEIEHDDLVFNLSWTREVRPIF